MITKESIDNVARLVFQSYSAQVERLKLSDKTAAELVGASRSAYLSWRDKDAVPQTFHSVIAMLTITPKLARMTESQTVGLRRKPNSAELIMKLDV